jgi:ubiquinone/menaquinone biosynthesis C-methylase UbiE
MAKDLFSAHAKLYAQFRPTYPQSLFDHIISFVKDKNTAWDCATGNGQAAMVLANHFQTVWATDISEAQLSNAIRRTIFIIAFPPRSIPFSMMIRLT